LAAAAAVALPRRISDASLPLLLALNGARVCPFSVHIWNLGKDGGRTDTFIGLINSINWTFYMAPCFGLAPGTVKGDSKGEIAAKIAKGDFPDDTVVMANSTSSADASMVKITKGELEKCYGKGNVCYTELDNNNSFDGRSHQAMNRWVGVHRVKFGAGEDFWFKALGYAIQRDKDGYYIRFASTLNLYPGQLAGQTTFAKKQVVEQVYSCCGLIATGTRTVDAVRTIEARDLPKEWTEFVENTLCRDLKLAVVGRDLMQSRGDGLKSRRTRIKEATPAAAAGAAGDFESKARLV